MKYYTEKQALEIAINSAGAAVNYINEVSGEVSGETIKTIAHGSMSKPSTFEVQKQIEAVLGLIKGFNLVYNDLKEGEKDYAEYLAAQEPVTLFEENLRTLIQTLKPYLNGEKLEV